MKKLLLAAVSLFALGIAVIAVEEVMIYQYLNSPFPEGVIGDKVVVREQTGLGVFLVILGGVAYAIGRLVQPARARPPPEQ